MPDAISIALSGLNAQQRRVDAISSNIANASTTGAVPTATTASTVYKPLDVSFTALTAGNEAAGVRADITENQNGYFTIYDPHNAYANSEGLVAAPQVDLAREIVNLLESKTLFRANISVIKTEKEMTGALLDAIG
jgi:flagellar basal-body rod protein FlgC